MRRLAALSLVFVLACDNDPTEASVANEIPGVTIEKTWFRTTLFAEPLETGQTSRTLRVGVGVENAFAVVRINGHPFIATTNAPVDAPEAEQTSIVFSPTTSRSLCFGEPRMSEEEQASIAARIFPGDGITTSASECGSP